MFYCTLYGPIYTAYDLYPATLHVEIEDAIREEFSVKPGWEVRPVYGKTLGDSTAHLFEANLKDYLEGKSKVRDVKLLPIE